MKIIDEKGRLFGKINIIDFLVVIFLLSFTSIFYYGYKIFFLQPRLPVHPPPPVETIVEPAKEFIEIDGQFRLINLSPDILKLFSVGDTEKDKDGQIIAKIVKMHEPQPQIYEFDIGGGKKITREDPILKNINADLHLRTEKKKNILYYKDRQIAMNSPIDFTTDKYKIEAVFMPLNTIDKQEENEKRQIYAIMDSLREDIEILKVSIRGLDAEVSKISNKKRK